MRRLHVKMVDSDELSCVECQSTGLTVRVRGTPGAGRFSTDTRPLDRRPSFRDILSGFNQGGTLGVRGPAPKPTALKRLEGTFRKDRVAVNEPMPMRTGLIPPDWLGEDALEEWNRVAPELDRLQLSTVVDYATFLGYCMSFARALEAEEEIAIHGLVLETFYGRVANPAVSIARTEWAQVRKFAAEFGLTPSARTRVSGTPKGDEQPDGAKLFLFGGKKGG